MAMLFMFCQTFIFSQSTITGKIIDDSNEPLIGASVVVKGTSIGTITDLDGNYTLNVPEGSTALVISYIGYANQIIMIADNSYGSITLSEDFNQLDEVVVTGLATTTQRRNLANSVAKIDAAELNEVAVANTVETALYGKFTGAEIKAASGAPGGGMSFRLRGVTSINASSQPLIVLDGVYLDNSSIPAGLNVVSAASGGGSTSNQDNPSNRLSDIDPNDIESIEILKGASAAAIYGSRAAGGVVIINTKRGKSGETNVRLSQSVGAVSQLNKLGIRDWTEDKVLASDFAGSIDEFRNNGITNYEDILYGNNGLQLTTRLGITGGNEKSKFYIGASHKDDEGIVENTGYKKTSARINFDHKINKVLELKVSSNYINSSADRGFFNNDNSGTTMGVSFTSTPSFAALEADPETGLFPANPFAPSNFLETAALVTNNESVNRFLGGATLTWNIHSTDNSSLKLIGRGGLDNYNLSTTAIFPNSLQFQRDGAGLNGVSVQGNTSSNRTNIAAFLNHSYYMDNGLSFTTSVGVDQFDSNRNTVLGDANGLIGSQSNLDQSSNRNLGQNKLIQQDKGFFAQEEINFDDKFMATIGLRADKSSNNGDPNQLYFYPKANLAVNIHNLGLFSTDGPITQLKARIAYGESGNFAIFGATATVLESAIVDGTAGSGVPATLGNSEIGPERQKELELGIDLEIFRRVSLDATYYIKNVEDLLFNPELPASTGFISQVTNAGELQNKGVEIGLNLGIINTPDLKWGSRFSFWANESEMLTLETPAETRGGFADFLGQYLIKEGFSPTTLIGVGPDPTVTLNGDGDPTLQIFGDAQADFQLSWMNQFSWKGLDLNFVWHWKQGGDNINLSTLLFDLNGTTHDFDDTGLDPDGVLTNGNYRLSVLGTNTDPYIEDAGYIRLREVGLYYTLPSIVNGLKEIKIGVSGNNLINIFDYNSYDPEVSNFGSGGLSTAVEVTPFPSSKRFDFHISILF